MKEKIEFIEQLIKMTEENNLSELSIDFKGFKVAIKKACPQQVSHTMMMSAPHGMTSAPVMQKSSGEAQKQEKSEIPSHFVPVRSPLAGVFYTAPKPGAPTFVQVGDVVEKEQVLCIIEAMKIMNEINSEIKGKVAKVCMENAKVANEGDILFYLEPVK